MGVAVNVDGGLRECGKPKRRSNLSVQYLSVRPPKSGESQNLSYLRHKRRQSDSTNVVEP
jgi:hypothetical protein